VKSDKPIRVSRQRPARQGLAGLLIGLFILVQVLAVSSPLHGFFHQDAAVPSHACVVTLFCHGQILVAAGVVDLLPPVFGQWLSPVTPRSSTVSGDVQLLPTRAPPFERFC
jgi:hypothetical protein